MLNIKKSILGELEKCYCISPITYKGEDCLLVASEKDFPCFLFNSSMEKIATVWEHPGGTMSMVPYPGYEGVFLATHRFYSPNDSKEASIVMVWEQDGQWQSRELAKLPHVHRFDILRGGDKLWLVACTLCSGRDYKDDWSYPGKTWACSLPTDPGEIEGLELESICDGMLKNHGYCKYVDNGVEKALVASDCGIYIFTPPQKTGEAWRTEILTNEASSDAVLIDLNGDGVPELVSIAPFHGDLLHVYEKGPEGYKKAWTYPGELEFLHAIWAGEVCGDPAVILGHRKSERNTIMLSWDGENYVTELIDSDMGAANVCYSSFNGKKLLIAANRETNIISSYELNKS